MNWSKSKSKRSWEQSWSGRWSWLPLHPSGPSYSSVPAWEKKFCESVCKIPWNTISETKWLRAMQTNVVEWNDSAALEALHNAKARFWAEINGLPCDIPVPDPDMYIDTVDHDAVIDPELVAEFEKPIPPPPEEDNDTNILEQPIVPTGWDDEYSVPQNNTWDIKYDSNNAWNAGSGKRGGGNHCGSKPRKSRYKVHNYQMDKRWTDNRGSNKANYLYEKTMPLAMS